MTVQSSNQATGILAQSTNNMGDVIVSALGDITVRGEGNTYGVSAISQGNSSC